MSMLHMEAAPRISRLPAGLVNQIAAGEVVERPASVVKELLENAVDAGATRIDVECRQGGCELIRIADDGCGIHPDDVELAITSHATSKLACADDLFRIQTMGFRGEALASIAEVSSFRMRTRTAEQSCGVELEVACGIVKAPRPCGCPVGTQIEVGQLFVKTPVRRKFLKTQATEFAHLSEQFTRIALAQPRLHFTLQHNDKLVDQLPAVDDLGDRIEQLFGAELRSRLIAVEGAQGALRLWGFAAHPEESRATRKAQYLFVNGRWIQDRTVQHALTEGYRGLLMIGRQPVCFLFLEVPPDEVDVNVHPTKAEVRFVDPQRLYRLVLSSLRTRFLGMNLGSSLSPAVTSSSASPGAVSAEASLFTSPAGDGGESEFSAGWHPPLVDDPRAQEQFAAWAKAELQAWQPRMDISDLEQRAAQQDAWETSLNSGRAADDAGACHELPGKPIASSDPPPVEAGSQNPLPSPDGATPAAPAHSSGIGRAMQVLDCYLVVEGPEGLTLIDQHALHERILYEHFRRRVLERRVEVQRLLMPVVAELTPREANLLLDQAELIGELGFEVSSFGGRTVALSAYPALLRKADPIELLRGMIEQLEASGGSVSRRDLTDSLLNMMACKAAIKAGQRLTPEEIDSLLAQRMLVDDHHHCPHGRPTALTLTRAELDRQFGRLG